jgi:hypothetical protein
MNNNVKLSEMTLGDLSIFALAVFLWYQAFIYLGWWVLLIYLLYAVVLTIIED